MIYGINSGICKTGSQVSPDMPEIFCGGVEKRIWNAFLYAFLHTHNYIKNIRSMKNTVTVCLYLSLPLSLSFQFINPCIDRLDGALESFLKNKGNVLRTLKYDTVRLSLIHSIFYLYDFKRFLVDTHVWMDALFIINSILCRLPASIFEKFYRKMRH